MTTDERGDEVDVDRRALAVELLGSKRPPLLPIVCGGRNGRHTLGAVYDTGDVAGIVVAMRRMKLPPDAVPGDPNASLDTYAYPLEGNDLLLGRCPHGVYHLTPERVREWLTHPAHERGDFITASWSRPADE